jgi:hypothetical protein
MPMNVLMLLRRRLRAALAGALMILFAAPALASAAEPGVTPLGFTNGRPVDEAASINAALTGPAGHKWVRMFFDWSQAERVGDDQYDLAFINGIDARIKALRAHGVRIVMTVQTPPAWAPSINTDAGAAKYAEFMGWLANHFKGKVDTWELWNEPNDQFFWPEGPKADRYAAMLKRTYPAIKAGDPSATVIVGGLVGNDFHFVQALYDHGAGSDFDGVGVHTDTSCRIDAPDVSYREPDGRVGQFSFTGYREVHAVMAAHGDADKTIWMTEIGWTAADDLPCTEGANAGKRSKGVSAAQQAEFLKQAYACIAADPYVKMASWFTLQDHVETSRFGLFDINGNKRPIFAALQAVGDGTGAGVDHDCGDKVDSDAPTVTISAPALYYQRFATRGEASDPTTSVTKIELWVDGKRIMRQKGARFDYDWFHSSKIGYGPHKVELRAYDEAGNVGVAGTTVTRGNPRKGARNVTAALGLKVKRSGPRLKVTGTVKPPKDGSFGEQPHGRLELRFERKTGGGWKRSRVRKGIGDGGVHYTYTTRQAGTWRVYAVLVADAPYRKTRTKVFTFRVG